MKLTRNQVEYLRNTLDRRDLQNAIEKMNEAIEALAIEALALSRVMGREEFAEVLKISLSVEEKKNG